jgi:pimeloyl-ACP methyl ester carboxylesterase
VSTFVLVHGSWHGGWCYARVAKMLRDAGHDVFTPTLTGMGERVHLAHQGITLDTYVSDVVNVLKFEDLNEVTLCGHSFAGVVITAVAAQVPERIKALVYLDAFVPEDGQSYFDLLTPEVKDLILGLARESGDVAPIPAAAFNVNSADAEWVDAMCVPQAIAPFAQGVKAGIGSIEIKKRTYIYASKSNMDTFEPFYETYRKDPSWDVHVVECGHDVMLDAPQRLVSILLSKEEGGSAGV